ncbi:MAG: hypothetical protein LBM01_02340 [Christensenellaceae bacterium]|jgi:hypothetical protein|nr:hypothetical protein [Christensenellaceae bacterium]
MAKGFFSKIKGAMGLNKTDRILGRNFYAPYSTGKSTAARANKELVKRIMEFLTGHVQRAVQGTQFATNYMRRLDVKLDMAEYMPLEGDAAWKKFLEENDRKGEKVLNEYISKYFAKAKAEWVQEKIDENLKTNGKWDEKELNDIRSTMFDSDVEKYSDEQLERDIAIELQRQINEAKEAVMNEIEPERVEGEPHKTPEERLADIDRTIRQREALNGTIREELTKKHNADKDKSVVGRYKNAIDISQSEVISYYTKKQEAFFDENVANNKGERDKLENCCKDKWLARLAMDKIAYKAKNKAKQTVLGVEKSFGNASKENDDKTFGGKS